MQRIALISESFLDSSILLNLVVFMAVVSLKRYNDHKKSSNMRGIKSNGNRIIPPYLFKLSRFFSLKVQGSFCYSRSKKLVLLSVPFRDFVKTQIKAKSPPTHSVFMI